MSEFAYLYRRHFGSFVDFAFRELNPDVPFEDNWHIQLLADLLELSSTVDEPEAVRRLIFNLPPGSLKTHVCSVALPAWLLGRDPRQSVLIISETPDHALDIQERCAELMASKRYRAIFPKTRIARRSKHLELSLGGAIRYAGVGSAWPTRRSDLVVIDNPQSLHSLERNNTQAFVEIDRTLRNPKRGLIVLATRRLGENDLTSYFERQRGWFAYSFPVLSLQTTQLEFPPDFQYKRRKGELLHPAMENWNELEGHLRELGGENFAWQYMQGHYLPQTTGQRSVVDNNGNPITLVGSFDPTSVAWEDFRKWKAEYDKTLSI